MFSTINYWENVARFAVLIMIGGGILVGTGWALYWFSGWIGVTFYTILLVSMLLAWQYQSGLEEQEKEEMENG